MKARAKAQRVKAAELADQAKENAARVKRLN
jgi:hypothetical protein